MRRPTTYSVKIGWIGGWHQGARAGLALLLLLTAAVGVTGPSAAAGGPEGFLQLPRPVRAQPATTEDCRWTPGFHSGGPDGTILALQVYDDGNGPALYAGGGFTTAGVTTVNNVARWDGSEWSTLTGAAGTGTKGTVNALAVYDGGRGEALYAGGFLTLASGHAVSRLARWDATGWSAVHRPVENGTNRDIYTLAVYDDDNVELVVKVLDACAAPYHKFWVFAAGLTNVEVTITVTDTLTGEEKQYHNPLSQEFQPILDTGAFATCDASEGGPPSEPGR